MKPLVTEGYVIASDAPGRAIFLREGGRTVTADVCDAFRFADLGEAERTMRDFVDRHRHAHHGVTTWEVVWATTRTTFRDA